MDKEIERILREHIEAEDEHYKTITTAVGENSETIRGLINDLRTLQSEQKTIRETIGPVHDFFLTMESVGRVGRVVRAIVGWFVLVLGTLTVVYVAVKDSVSGE